MASIYSSEYIKERILYEEIISKYHSDYNSLNLFEYEKIQKQIDKNHLNFEFLVEECMSIVGNLQHSSTFGEDFKDGSDAKTISLYFRTDIPQPYWYRGIIRDVYRKTDLLRVVIFNKPYFRLDYMLFKLSEVNFDKTKQKNININFNAKKDSYGRFDNYRVRTFEELCKKI